MKIDGIELGIRCERRARAAGGERPLLFIKSDTGCSGKIVFFFTIHRNPSIAYIAVRDLQSSQRNASVQSLLLAGNFCTTNSSRVLARERWQTFENS